MTRETNWQRNEQKVRGKSRRHTDLLSTLRDGSEKGQWRRGERDGYQ
jgi:hypothetical protein